MKTNSVFWVSRIWLVIGILIVFSFLLVSQQAHASGGRVQVEIRIPAVLTVQYTPNTGNAHNGVKVGTSRDIGMKRAILIETTDTLPGKDQPEKPSTSVKRVYMTIYTL